ncbi:hypothetical protein F53441_3262 [Fusarium austroafricanum]|uniref:Uncharacterized protein n=1 Tax=Fusarium austroafricanum TaxID=2364996 RepID=A0A8H4P329_9HYPO|nr:hypothetical protein F53441_3262 [Fusarium austroafricanum]
MKFSLFSFVALAASAMAAPAAVSPRQVPADAVGAASPGTIKKLDVVSTSSSVTKTVTQKISQVPMGNTGGVVKVLTIAVDQVKTQTTTIKTVIKNVKSSAVSKADASKLILTEVHSLNEILTAVVNQLKDVVSIKINLPDVQVILGLVIKLLHELVGVAKEVLSILGLDNVIGTAFELLFKTVATLLNLVTKLIGDIVPGLVDILSNILDTLSGTPLGPIIKPVSNIFDGLTSYLSQGTN